MTECDDRRSALRWLALALILAMLVGQCGCVSVEQLQSVREHLTRAEGQLAEMETYRDDARQALELAKQVDAQFGTDATHEAVQRAQQALAVAEEAVPATRQTVERLRTGLSDMERSIEQGDNWWGILAAAAGTVLPAAGIAIEGFRRSRKRWIETARQNARYGERVERVHPDDGEGLDRVKARALVEQAAAGVHDLVQVSRGKA